MGKRLFYLFFFFSAKRKPAESEEGSILKCLETGRRRVLGQGWLRFIY